jgi:hypothetical protein
MQLIKTASGKQTIKLSKKEWTNIGKKAGWIKIADFENNDGWHESRELSISGNVFSSYGERLSNLADLAYDGFDDDILIRNATLMKTLNDIIRNMSDDFRKMEDIMIQIDKLQAKGYGEKGEEILKDWSN